MKPVFVDEASILRSDDDTMRRRVISQKFTRWRVVLSAMRGRFRFWFAIAAAEEFGVVIDVPSVAVEARRRRPLSSERTGVGEWPPALRHGRQQ